MVLEINKFQQVAQQITQSISQVVIGKEEVVEKLLICLLAKGHVLIEDVPGIGKTTMVSALAKTLDLSFNRIQFTSDLMPSDITGFNMYHPQSGELIFQKGAIMAHLVLTDEINRSSPKTQSALLEVMQENQISIDGTTYQLPQPFMVLATQNAIEHLGTFPLPEAQLDRFLMRVRLGYPSYEQEMRILELDSQQVIETNLQTILNRDDILMMQQQVSQVFCHDDIKRYIVNLLDATRHHPKVELGASPRAGQMLLKAAKAKALLSSRDYISVDDVRALVIDVLSHRITLKEQQHSPDEVLVSIMSSLVTPK